MARIDNVRTATPRVHHSSPCLHPLAAAWQCTRSVCLVDILLGLRLTGSLLCDIPRSLRVSRQTLHMLHENELGMSQNGMRDMCTTMPTIRAASC